MRNFLRVCFGPVLVAAIATFGSRECMAKPPASFGTKTAKYVVADDEPAEVDSAVVGHPTRNPAHCAGDSPHRGDCSVRVARHGSLDLVEGCDACAQRRFVERAGVDVEQVALGVV